VAINQTVATIFNACCNKYCEYSEHLELLEGEVEADEDYFSANKMGSMDDE